MKQHITPEQLNELSEKGRKRLADWWQPSGYQCFYDPKYGTLHEVGLSYKEKSKTFHIGTEWDQSGKLVKFYKRKKEDIIPLLSIGQLVEFLEEGIADMQLDYMGYEWNIEFPSIPEWFYSHKELCDALWNCVKEILNE